MIKMKDLCRCPKTLRILIAIDTCQRRSDSAGHGPYWTEGLNEEGVVLPELLDSLTWLTKRWRESQHRTYLQMLMFGVNEWKETSAEIAKDKMRWKRWKVKWFIIFQRRILNLDRNVLFASKGDDMLVLIDMGALQRTVLMDRMGSGG